MTFNFSLKPILALLLVVWWQFVLIEQASAQVAQPSMQSRSDESSNLNNKARVVIEWSTFFDSTSMTKTEISVDQKVVCNISASDKICDITIEPGKRELKLNTNLDFGTFSEQYDLEAGKRYKFNTVINADNLWMDSLFGGLPVSAIFNKKGKTATLKFELINVTTESK